MGKMYYIEYKCYNMYGELYAVDTGYGIIELGQIEDNKIYEDSALFRFDNLQEYLNNFQQVLSCTKVL